jgi:hypothetical protein
MKRMLEQDKALADVRRRHEEVARERRDLEEALDCAGAELKRLTLVEVNLRKHGEGLEADKAALQVRADTNTDTLHHTAGAVAAAGVLCLTQSRSPCC